MSVPADQLRAATDDELQLADELDASGKRAEPLAPPGFFHNALDGVPESIGRGALKVVRTGAMLAPAVPEAFGTGLTPEGQAWWFQHTVDPLTDVIDGMAPDASTTGTAGQVLNGLTEFGVSFAGGPVTAIATAETDSATELVQKGVDANTATAVGAVQGLATAAGVKLPVLGKTLAARLLTGAGGNLAVAEGSREASQSLLADNPDLAQQYQGDGTSRAVDVLMGLAFGGGVHMMAARDAALTARNADHFANRSAPGEPATGAAAVAHQQAMSEAGRQLDAGQPVNVADKIDLGDFALHPELTAAGAKPRDVLHAMPVEQRRTLRYNAPELDSYAALIEQQYGLPNGIINALKNAGEKSASTSTSPAGARGVMQFMPENLKKYGITDATDPLQMIEAAGRYLRDTSKQYGGNVDAMIADYNGGPRQAKRVLEGKTPAAKETAAYLERVRAYMGEDGQPRAMAQESPQLPLLPDTETRVPGERVPFAEPDDIARTAWGERMAAYDIPEDVLRDTTPLPPRDGVTGFYDGRMDGFKARQIERAQAHVAATGEQAHYVSADVANLGGLNAFVGDRAEAANAHYRAIAEIADRELRATGADVVPMRTGGDEFGAVVVGADAKVVAAALDHARGKVAAYVRKQGLADIPNPKRSTERGLGVHVGVSAIRPGETVRAILDDADAGVHLSKQGSSGNVRRNQAGEARAAAPGGQAGGTESRAGTPSRGVRGAGEPAAGSEAGKPAGLTPETPLDAIDRLAAEAPDTPLLEGFDGNGEPIYRTAQEIAADIAAERLRAETDAAAYMAAANCAIRSGN